MIGKKLGHFEITAAIGRGGMGEVFAARDTILGRDVAIKTLPEEFQQDAERLARFEREARLLASLNHQNIAAIHGLEQAGAVRFLVLELVEGETLAEKLELGRLPVEEALRLGLQMAEALEAAHERGVVHRDLKPANVKITPEGRAKVLDFGIAKALAPAGADGVGSRAPTINNAATGHGVVLGTPGYMSPEQVCGQTVGPRTDVWAFGVVLFEMLSGQVAFGGSTLADTQASVLKSDPDWSRLPSRLHPRVRAMLERCLAKDVRQRYAGIADARVDLQAALQDPKGVSPVTSSPLSRHSLVFSAGAVVLASVAAVLTWNAKPVPEPRVTHFEVATVGALPEEGAAIALSPDLRHLVYPANNRLYRRDLNRPDDAASPVPGTENGANPFFSPDSQWLGFFTQDALLKVNLVSDERVLLANTNDGWFGEWSDDGRIFFGHRGNSALWSVPEAGGVARELIALEDGALDLDHPEVLPGSRWLLYVQWNRGDGGEASPSRTIMAVATDGSGVRRVVKQGTRQGSHSPRYVDTGHLLFVDGGALWAAGFDASRLEFTTDPVRVVDAVSASATGPRASYSIGRDGSIVYVAPPPQADPPGLLALIDLDAGGREYVGLGAARYRNPRFSPDGSRVLFETVESDGRSAVWVFAQGDRAAARRLTIAGSNHHPLWLDDDSVLYASDRDGTQAIYRQSVNTDDAERLLEPITADGDCPVSWDPDQHLLFINRQGCLTRDTWLTVLAADGTVQVPQAAPSVGYGAEISRNNAYVASFPGPNLVEVRRFPVTDEVWRVGSGGAYPIWSPDGASVVYRRASQIPQRTPTQQMVRVTVSTGRSFGQLTEEVLPIEGFSANFGYRDYDFAADGRLLMVVDADPDYAPPEPGITVVLNWAEILRERVPLP